MYYSYMKHFILPLAAVFFYTACGASHFTGAGYKDGAEPIYPSAEAEPQSAEMASRVMTMDQMETEEQTASVDSAVSEDRKRIYSGQAAILVEDAEETRETLESLSRDAGGYVESSYSEWVTLRLPVEAFERTFEAILSLGELQSSRIETWDVTDTFTDLEARLKTAITTRERLYVLLEKSSSPEERAKILKEIGRLSEEIAVLEQHLKSINDRVDYSRIVVQIIPRISVSDEQEIIPFEWIAYLDPLTPAGTGLRGRIDVNLGSDYAVFSKDKIFLAQNNDGIQISLSTIDNTPRADERFWQEALDFHLGPLYAESRIKDIQIGRASMAGVEFLSKDRNPYRMYIGVIEDGKHLHILQIFVPNDDLDISGVFEAFAAGEWK